MTILETAKSRVRGGSVKEAFRNEDGAIDLASIMVGIIVIGIIGGVIAATVFAVIPWAQDNAAKGQLDSVATAQSAYQGFTSETGAASFGSEAQLKNPTPAAAQGKALFSDPNNIIAINAPVVNGVSTTYTAYTKSASGKVYASTDGAKAGDPLTAAQITALPTQVKTDLGLPTTP